MSLLFLKVLKKIKPITIINKMTIKISMHIQPKSYYLKNQLAQQFLIDQKKIFESNIIILHSRFHSQGLEGYLHG